MGRKARVVPTKLPRLERCSADREYSQRILWFGPLIVSLEQLERLQRRSRKPPCEGVSDGEDAG